MATAAEIAAMAERVIAPESTLALLVDLYAAGTETCTDAAKLLEWHIDERATFGQSLVDERAEVKRLDAVCDEYVARLNRIGDHLRTLTVYAEGDNDHTPPPATRGRKRRSAGGKHDRADLHSGRAQRGCRNRRGLV